MIRRFFSTTLGQILAIIATASAVTFLLFLVLLSTFYTSVPPPPPWPWPAVYRIEGLIHALQAVPETEWPVILAAAERPDMTIRLTEAAVICASLTRDTRDLQSALAAELSDITLDLTVRACSSDASPNDLQLLVNWTGRKIEFGLVRWRGGALAG